MSKLPPLPFTNYVGPDGMWEEQYGPYSKDDMLDYGEACRAAALEEAARVCDHEYEGGRNDGDEQWSKCGEYCAAAIRALKDQKQP